MAIALLSTSISYFSLFLQFKRLLCTPRTKRKKKILLEEIQDLKNKKELISEKKEIMLDDKKASQKIKDELFLPQDKSVEIIKFQENEEKYNTEVKTTSLLQGQKLYILIAGILQLGLVIFFFYRRFYINVST